MRWDEVMKNSQKKKEVENDLLSHLYPERDLNADAYSQRPDP